MKARRTRGALASAVIMLMMLAALVATANLNAAGASGAAQIAPDLGYLTTGPAPDPLNRLAYGTATHPAPRRASDLAPKYKTAPADLPPFSAQVWPGDVDDGYLFVSPFDFQFTAATAYIMILDNDGEVIYYDNPSTFPFTSDFKKQPNGLISYFKRDDDGNRFEILNEQYKMVHEYHADGHDTDGHDLQILPNGNALLLIHDVQIRDMSAYPGGSPETPVVGCIVQEVTSDNQMVFEWRSWDYLDEIEFTDSNRPISDSPFFYIHCNSVELDMDGNLLISSRHLDEITKISRQTGDIIWRLGGRKSDFTFVNDYGFAYQHDARRLPNGRLTVYDNGVARNPLHSRGVEYVIDEVNMTAEATAVFRTSPDTYGLAMGNMQTLPSGHRVVGWGRSSAPVLTEFDSAGNRLLELSTEAPYASYRAFRFAWQGFPTWPPALAVELNEDIVELFFSWNGSTETVAYRIMGGTSPTRLREIATVAREGFETRFLYQLPDDRMRYFRVIPLDAADREGILSNVSIVVPNGETHYLAAVFAN